jgi:shikimate dehydrogenase
MKRFAVIGHPIGHSLSPLMHNTAFELLGMNCRYEMLDIDPSDLETAFARFREKEWGGVNVTIPHKESVIPLLDEIAPQAEKAGAVNTVANRDGRLTGYNTDIIGIERSLQAYRERIRDKSCVILGSGGAARSMTHVLVETIRPSRITYAALIPEQGKALVESFMNSPVHLQVIPYIQETIENAIADSVLVVNATNVGMFPDIGNTPVANGGVLTKEHIVFDVIYRPLKTRFLTQASEAGAATIGGLDMFVHQGAASFEIWTGKKMPIIEVRKRLEEKLVS